MTKKTFRLLQVALNVWGDKEKKKTLPYLLQAQKELEKEIARLQKVGGFTEFTYKQSSY